MSVRLRGYARCAAVTFGVVLLAGIVSPAGPAAFAASVVPASATAATAADASDTGDGAGGSALSEADAQARAKSSGKSVEVTGAETETSEEYALPDGSFETTQHLRPVRARVGGVWKAVDNTLVTRSDGTVGPRVSANPISFSGGGDGPMVSIRQASRTLGFSWPAALPTPVLDGDTATYASVLPGVDLQLRADTDGYHEVLVVHSASAAQNPKLADLELGVSAPGMTVKAAAGGGLEADDDATGGVVFEGVKPLMWDSTGADSTAEQPAARTVSFEARAADDATGGDPAGDPSQAPTEASNVAPVGVDVSPDGSKLSLTPDQGLLTDSSTTYPVYIDPHTSAPKASDWTMVSRYWADSPQYKFNGDSDAGVGYCGWDYCAPYDVKRLFFKLPTSSFSGKTILDATFTDAETWSGSCSASDVELWRTKAFGSSTTWNSSSDNWLDKLDTRDVAYGNSSSCPSHTVEFDAKSAVKYASDHDSAYTYFGLRASDESDKYGWKRFSDKASLTVTFNRSPKQIKMSQLSMSPGGACAKSADKTYVNELPDLVARDVTDPDGDTVSVQFQLWWDAGDGKGFAAHWTSAKLTAKKSGSDFKITLTSDVHVPEDTTVAWYARAVDHFNGDAYSYSPWSGAGSATGCYFSFDNSYPSGPAISSGDYPQSDPSDPNDPWYDGVGKYGTFTLTASDSDVVEYEYGVNADPSTKNTVATSNGAPQTIQVQPTQSGLNWVSARAVDKYGNTGKVITTYQFRVKAGQPERAGWSMDDAASATQAVGSSGSRDLQVEGNPTLGVDGVIGKAVHFDGVDDYLRTDIPTVDTSTGFSVSAWVKLDSIPTGAAVAVAQPGNNSPGFELYYSQVYNRWAFNQYSADTASATPVRVMQASAGGVTAGQWTHLVGTYSSTDDDLALYVDGTLAGTVPYTTPWDARRGLQIGASSYDGAPSAFFPGTIDDVRVYDKPLSATEVANLHGQQAIGSGRPARAIFPLDEDPADADGNPTTTLTGHAEVNPLTLEGGASLGADGVQDGALSLDGTDDYATTSPHLNNQRGYTITAWAKLSGTTPPDHAAIVAGQEGQTKPGVELYYSSTYGWSFDNYTSDDANGTVVRSAQGDTSHVVPGEWTQLTGTYDPVADQLQLYVNGAPVGAPTSFSHPFYAGGPFQVGAGFGSGVVKNFFGGEIDDVRLYDRTLTAPEVAALYTVRAAVAGHWKLDTAGGSPVTSADEAGLHPLTLGSGASIDTSGNSSEVGPGGLLLDGTANGYASTAQSPINTGSSFTASAWVALSARPQKTVTVMSMAGSQNNGFSVRYVPDATDPADLGSWQLVMAGADSTSATVATADAFQYDDVGFMTSLVVVYDAFAGEMRLYVNGNLSRTLCADDDDDGVPNDPACTEKVSWNDQVQPFEAKGGLQIGRERTATGAWGDYMSGAVDDVWLLQGVASDEQVAQLADGADVTTSEGP